MSFDFSFYQHLPIRTTDFQLEITGKFLKLSFSVVDHTFSNEIQNFRFFLNIVTSPFYKKNSVMARFFLSVSFIEIVLKIMNFILSKMYS